MAAGRGTPDFVIRDWRLEANDGDQAPLHVHHAADEAFVCLDGDLVVEVDGSRRSVQPGTFVLVPRGSVHTFATRRGAHVLAVMGPDVAALVDELHDPMSDDDRAAVWGRHRSSLAGH